MKSSAWAAKKPQHVQDDDVVALSLMHGKSAALW